MLPPIVNVEREEVVKIKEVLRQLNLGNSVAEFDTELENYFVETETFRLLIKDEGDIIAGDKGTGKTALYRILIHRYQKIPSLDKVEVVPAFNTTGSPIFQRLTEGAAYTEGQYRTIWKTYILSLAGHWLLQTFDGKLTASMVKLDELLTKLNLRVSDDKPDTIFSRLVTMFQRITNPKSAGVEFSFDEAGMPVIAPQVEFADNKIVEDEGQTLIRHAESLGLLNSALGEADRSAWVVLDRLDEAFTGYPKTEIPALRALFRTYLDLLQFDRIKLKMFVRRDLFRRITQAPGGFVNLTHINARKIEIVWDSDDLLSLLIRRIKTNIGFVKTAGLEGKSPNEVFYALFPERVDSGTQRAKTLSWMLSRIRDGNSVSPPRNLIDLVKKAQEEQLRREVRNHREFSADEVLITPEAIKGALKLLSKQRVEDTLLAESGFYKQYIERFRNGKAEHNDESLMKTLNISAFELQDVTRVLTDLGFLEKIGVTYKVPILYRDGLNITQGKAFQV